MDEFEAILETGSAAAVELAASALAERGGKTVSCPNCAKPMIGPYCALCGQPLNTHRRSLGHLLKEVLKDIASFDSRILRTAQALLLRPGELPKAFREGRTQRYVPAVRLYFFVTLLFFVFLYFTGISLIQLNLTVDNYRLVHDASGQVFKEHGGKRALMEGFHADAAGAVTIVGDKEDKEDGDKLAIPAGLKADGTLQHHLNPKVSFFHHPVPVDEASKPAIDQELSRLKSKLKFTGARSDWFKKSAYQTLDRLRDDPTALNGPLETWIPRILFVLLPLFATLLALFYRHQRKHYFFVDHLVFSLTIHSFGFVLMMVAAGLAQLVPGVFVAKLTLIVLALYVFLSLKTFYGQGWVKTGLKFTGIAFIYAVFFLIPALAFALVASVFGA